MYLSKGFIIMVVGCLCIAIGFNIVLSIFASFNIAPMKKIAWDNVTDEYETFLKIKDVKEVDELFNILKDEKIERIEIKEGAFKIYNDIFIDITDNKVNKISSGTMQAIYDMENEPSSASVSYDGNVEILTYTNNVAKPPIKVVRVGNNEYWAHKFELSITFVLLIIFLFAIGLALIISYFTDIFD